MPISTSSNAVVLPGVDTTLQTNMNVAINTNTTVLSLLSGSATATGVNSTITAITGVSTNIGNLPNYEPLPTFGVWSNYQNNPGYQIYDNDMQPIMGGYQSTNTEIGQRWTGPNYTTGNIGGNSQTTNWVGATCFTQQEGNQLLNLPGQYSMGGDGIYGRSPDYVSGAWGRFGLVQGNTGIRQKMSLYFSDGNIGIYPKGGTSPIEQININSTTYSTWFGGNAYAQIAYNQRTKTLMALESKDTANNYRLHIWKNINRDLNDSQFSVGTLHLYLSEAKTSGATPAAIASNVYYAYNDFAWQANNSQNYTESRYRSRIIAADNGVCAIVRHVNGNGVYMAQFTPNLSTLTGTLNTSFNSAGATNGSAGWDSDPRYGIRSNISWDNQWACIYAPYYAYGSGMTGYFVNTADPSKYFTYNFTSTTHGGQLVPFRQGKFVFNDNQQNSDGNVGARLWVIDVEGYALNGRYYNQAAITNGSAIGLTDTQVFTYQFDTRYTSTNYPTLFSPDIWTNG
jgi:hypothetical protein